MALSTTQLNADLAAMLADLTESATIGGTAYECNRVSLSRIEWEQRSREVMEATKVVLSFQESDFTTQPAVNSVVTYGGEVLRVLDKSESPDGLDLRLYLGARYSR